MSTDSRKKTLTDVEITTDHPQSRRAILGVMGAAGIGAALIPAAAKAQAVDGDNGEWTDAASCPRGSGGIETGVTDQDGGSLLSDLPGSGRGAPYC